MSFLEEIKRRKILQVAAIYAVVAWLLIQIVATVEEPLRLPEWFDTAVIVLLVIGFPITLIISWAFNVTPEGLIRDDGSPGVSDDGSRKIEYALIGLLIVAMLWVLYRVEFQSRPIDVESVQTEQSITEPRVEEPRPQVLPDSVAVLPFANLSPDPDNAFFAAGIHEEILSQLAKIKGVNVIARTSVLRYADDPPPVPDIAKALNVETVMEGSVRFAGDSVRVTAQLIDGATGSHLWTESYNGDLSDVFAIQADIATAVATALEAELLPKTRARLEKPPTVSPAAYALYLEARTGAAAGIARAIQLLNRAIALDAEFAQAYALKAFVAATALASPTTSALRESAAEGELVRSAIDNADRALSLDPDTALAFLARGTVNRISWRWKSAQPDMERALELSPNDAVVVINSALFKAELGDVEEGLALVRRVAQLDPNQVLSYYGVAILSHYAGDFEAALTPMKIGSELNPSNPLAPAVLAYSYRALGDYATATSFLKTAEDLITDDASLMLPPIAYTYGLMGRADDAMRAFRRFEAWADSRTVGNGDWIFAYLGIGDSDAAYERLRRTVETVERGEPDAGYIALNILKNNIHSDPVLDQPRFRELFDQIDAIARSR